MDGLEYLVVILEAKTEDIQDVMKASEGGKKACQKTMEVILEGGQSKGHSK